MNKFTGIYMVIPILIVISISSYVSYKSTDKSLISIFIIFLLLCFLKVDFIFFIPLICYDLFFYRMKYFNLFFLIPFLIHIDSITTLSIYLIISYVFISFILRYRTDSLANIKKNFYNLSDSSKELEISFEKKNKELLEKQDYEIKLATLKERNRIAGDIHDNVGHLLSRCLLQIGALLAINKNNPNNENLKLIKNTLSEAMDSIRNSVHKLHDDSIDFNIEIQNLVNNFKFCPIKLDYDIENTPNKKIQYALLTITKEAFSNIIKHSNANEVFISLYEHPALYQLIIKDNGTKINYNTSNGIGIKNLISRVDLLKGNVHISADRGFRIFISIPKVLDEVV